MEHIVETTTLIRRRPHPQFGTRYWVELGPRHGSCWIWNGHVDRDGYGRTAYGFKQAHRVMYEEQIGPIPEGWEIDHTCNQRDCVNPAHLEAVTHAENDRRKNERILARRNGECANGHDLAVTRRWYSEGSQNEGKWWCLSCSRERRARQRAAA